MRIIGQKRIIAKTQAELTGVDLEKYRPKTWNNIRDALLRQFDMYTQNEWLLLALFCHERRKKCPEELL